MSRIGFKGEGGVKNLSAYIIIFHLHCKNTSGPAFLPALFMPCYDPLFNWVSAMAVFDDAAILKEVSDFSEIFYNRAQIVCKGVFVAICCYQVSVKDDFLSGGFFPREEHR